MQQAQGDFWKNPTGVIRNRNPAPFWFSIRSNFSLRQSPPFFSISQRTLYLSCCKIIGYFFCKQAFSLCKPCRIIIFSLFDFLTAKLGYHTATYLRNQKNLSKKCKKSSSTQIGCAEITIFAS